MRISRQDLDIAVNDLNKVSKQKYAIITYDNGDQAKYRLIVGGLLMSLTGLPKPMREVYTAVQGILNYLYYEKKKMEVGGKQ